MGSIIAKATGSQREPIPAGNHIARCYSIVQIGTIEQTWEGKTKQAHKVRITFELPNLQKDFDGVMKPRYMAIPRTLSLNKKARLRAELESWRGVPFTDAEAEGFDIAKLIGVPCLLNIIINEDGYDRVSAITPVPQGTVVPPQFNPSMLLSYDDWDQAKFEALPDFIREQMEKTPEFAALNKKMEPAPTAPAVPTPQNVVDQVAEVKEKAAEPTPKEIDVEANKQKTTGSAIEVEKNADGSDKLPF